MREYFLFNHGGRYYRYVALSFGYGRSALWFTKLLKPLVRYIRERLGYRILPYIDDLRVATLP